jgi:hypothetical protein
MAPRRTSWVLATLLVLVAAPLPWAGADDGDPPPREAVPLQGPGSVAWRVHASAPDALVALRVDGRLLGGNHLGLGMWMVEASTGQVDAWLGGQVTSLTGEASAHATSLGGDLGQAALEGCTVGRLPFGGCHVHEVYAWNLPRAGDWWLVAAAAPDAPWVGQVGVHAVPSVALLGRSTGSAFLDRPGDFRGGTAVHASAAFQGGTVIFGGQATHRAEEAFFAVFAARGSLDFLDEDTSTIRLRDAQGAWHEGSDVYQLAAAPPGEYTFRVDTLASPAVVPMAWGWVFAVGADVALP